MHTTESKLDIVPVARSYNHNVNLALTLSHLETVYDSLVIFPTHILEHTSGDLSEVFTLFGEKVIK